VSAEVWYRKWRPQTFAEITGQEHVTRTLANAVAQGRIAHAYLLCGPRGTGKTSTARVLAKAVNCVRPVAGEPCNACESCRAVAEGRALDLVEMDAASNRGIDDIRNLRDRVGYHPATGRYRVYLIDEVHELTVQAFDALLKTLEEPPAHVIFVLATTDPHRVPATILSRCQRFDLARVRHGDIVVRLRHIAAAEGVAAEPDALEVIARAATGSLRDAVNLLEQLTASFGPALTAAQAREGLGLIADDRARQLALLAARGALSEGLALIARVHDDGVEMRQFNREVVAHLRALLLARYGAEAGLEGWGPEAVAALRREADDLEARRILRALRAFSGAEFRGEAQPSLPLELALAEVALAAEPEADRAPAPAPAGPGRPPAPAATPPRQAADGPSVRGRPGATALPIAGGGPAGPAAPNGRAPEGPAARPAAGAVPAVSTLEEARARFRDIYNACNAVHRPTGGYLNSGCDIIAFDGQTITFGFEHAVLAERLLPGTHSHRVLSGAVEQVFGRRLDVQCIQAPGVLNRLRELPPRPSHLLDEARRLGLREVTKYE
jgi:DNA polymerase-3 subunit gamma/tau